MAESTKQSKALTSPGYLLPFIILTALFFIFGFITNLNMGLVPELKKIFEIQGLATWQAMLANFAFFTAYFVFSTPASWLIEAIGYKRTMVVSLFVQVVGAALFLPAAHLVSFPLFLAAIFVVGAGVATLQTAANPYVAILGPEESSPIRLTLAQAANSLGGTFAPWIAGTFILAGAVLDPAKVALESPAVQHADQVLIANTVRMPYAIIAVALAILGIAVAFMRLPHIDQPPSSHVSEGAVASTSIWSYRHTVLGALGIFVYVGVEVGLATTMVLYFSDTSTRRSQCFVSSGGAKARTVLLARRATWTPARLLDIDHDQGGQAARHFWCHSRRPGLGFHTFARLCSRRRAHSGRLLQLHHVPEYLCAGNCGTRAND